MDEQPVVVFEKIGVNLSLGDYEGFIKVEFGHSRVSPSSSSKDVEKTTRKVQAWNDKQIAKRVKELRKAARGKK